MKYKILPAGAFSGALANNRFVVKYDSVFYELDIESVSVAGMEFDVYDYKQDTHPVFRVPIDLRGGTFNVTLRNDVNKGNNTFYSKVRSKMRDIIYDDGNDYYFGYLKDIISNLDVFIYRVNSERAPARCSFFNVLPIGINQTELSHDNSNSTVKIQITFSYESADLSF